MIADCYPVFFTVLRHCVKISAKDADAKGKLRIIENEIHETIRPKE